MKKNLLSLLLLVCMATVMNAQNFVVGDMNRDNELTVSDVTALVSVILGTSEMTYITADDFGLDVSDSTPILVGDMNRDDELTVSDVTALVSAILGTSEIAYITIIDFVFSGEHAYVNLGLPSGTLWATCNIGAENPEDYGDYFTWGETVPCDLESEEEKTNKWIIDTEGEQILIKYCNDSSCGYNGFTDALTELELEDDAAYKNWGSDWRMPSKNQIAELINKNYTTTEWITLNGVNGCKITSKRDGFEGNSIFLPASGSFYLNGVSSDGVFGQYWSRTLDLDYPYCACGLWLSSSSATSGGGGGRSNGCSVRPVRILN